MKLNDIIALAKSGYSVAEVKELLTLGNEEPETPQPETPQPETPQPETPQPETPQPEEDKTDYKSLYEETKKQLEAAQKLNTKQNMKGSEPPADEAVFTEFAKSFM